ncbi:MAG: hypothetical protein LBT08_03715 [Synergistaceae bacterium]|jgi:hypothetical protein|nr:hypothetical protein [Synergistaceae bacterium]
MIPIEELQKNKGGVTGMIPNTPAAIAANGKGGTLKQRGELTMPIDDKLFNSDTPNEETAAALLESRNDHNLIGPFKNIDDFMVSLLSDDDA